MLIKFWKKITGIDELEWKIDELQNALSDRVLMHQDDTTYYEGRIKKLDSMVNKAVKIIDMKKWKAVRKVDPRDYLMGVVKRYSQADQVYNVYDQEHWKEILTEIGNTFQATWTEEIFDCDDFSLLFAGLLAYSSYRAKLPVQPALAIAWSKTHAFNVFIDKNGLGWVYEPQNNTVIGRLGKTTGKYFVTELWFMS